MGVPELVWPRNWSCTALRPDILYIHIRSYIRVPDTGTVTFCHITRRLEDTLFFLTLFLPYLIHLSSFLPTTQVRSEQATLFEEALNHRRYLPSAQSDLNGCSSTHLIDNDSNERGQPHTESSRWASQ